MRRFPFRIDPFFTVLDVSRLPALSMTNPTPSLDVATPQMSDYEVCTGNSRIYGA